MSLEDIFAQECSLAGIPEPKRQYKFHGSRKYLADFAWPEYKLIVEINGGIWMPKSGHNTGGALKRDYAKSNAAQLMGYIFLVFTRDDVEDGTAIRAICDYLGRCEE